MIRFL